MKVFPGSKAWMRMDRARRKQSRRARRLGITEFELLVRETLAFQSIEIMGGSVTRRGLFRKVGAAFAGVAVVATMGKNALAKCLPVDAFREFVGLSADGKHAAYLVTPRPVKWASISVPRWPGDDEQQGPVVVSEVAHVEAGVLRWEPYTPPPLSEDERFLQEMYDRRWEGGRQGNYHRVCSEIDTEMSEGPHASFSQRQYRERYAQWERARENRETDRLDEVMETLRSAVDQETKRYVFITV